MYNTYIQLISWLVVGDAETRKRCEPRVAVSLILRTPLERQLSTYIELAFLLVIFLTVLYR